MYFYKKNNITFERHLIYVWDPLDSHNKHRLSLNVEPVPYHLTKLLSSKQSKKKKKTNICIPILWASQPASQSSFTSWLCDLYARIFAYVCDSTNEWDEKTTGGSKSPTPKCTICRWLTKHIREKLFCNIEFIWTIGSRQPKERKKNKSHTNFISANRVISLMFNVFYFCEWKTHKVCGSSHHLRIVSNILLGSQHTMPLFAFCCSTAAWSMRINNLSFLFMEKSFYKPCGRLFLSIVVSTFATGLFVVVFISLSLSFKLLLKHYQMNIEIT